MKRILKRYIKWRYPEHARKLELIQSFREGDHMRVVYEYKPQSASLFSKERKKQIRTIDSWEMMEYLYYSADGRTD